MFAGHVVYSTERAEIGIRVCFCSDMDEEPQSTDQSTDRGRKRGRERKRGRGRKRGKGSHEGRRRRGGREVARASRRASEIQIRTWKLFSCVLS